MSTYYYIACTKCHEYGGFLSRQAWGWGNFDIVDTFAFVANHIAFCSQENLRFIDEHEAYSLEGWTHIIGPVALLDTDEPPEPEHGEHAAAYPLLTFPFSDDWTNHKDLYARYNERREALNSERT